MNKILVTGGCGYIGAHTIVDLIQNGFDIICADNNSRSTEDILVGVEKIINKKIKNYKVDLCNYDDTYAIFQENTDIKGIIHFAAYKAVGESVENPMLYFENNISSLINVLKGDYVNEGDVIAIVLEPGSLVLNLNVPYEFHNLITKGKS